MGTYVDSQLDILRTRADEYSRIIAAIQTRDGVSTYELDTGQGRQRVTAADLPQLERSYAELIVRIDNLEDRVGGNVAFHGRPSW